MKRQRLSCSRNRSERLLPRSHTTSLRRPPRCTSVSVSRTTLSRVTVLTSRPGVWPWSVCSLSRHANRMGLFVNLRSQGPGQLSCATANQRGRALGGQPLQHGKRLAGLALRNPDLRACKPRGVGGLNITACRYLSQCVVRCASVAVAHGLRCPRPRRRLGFFPMGIRRRAGRRYDGDDVRCRTHRR